MGWIDVGGATELTGLLSRYNLQQSMLAPLSRFGSRFVCQEGDVRGWSKACQRSATQGSMRGE